MQVRRPAVIVYELYLSGDKDMVKGVFISIFGLIRS